MYTPRTLTADTTTTTTTTTAAAAAAAAATTTTKVWDIPFTEAEL